MILDDTTGTDVEDVFRGNDAHWLDRVPPEVEWDESEATMLVREIVGESRVTAYA